MIRQDTGPLNTGATPTVDEEFLTAREGLHRPPTKANKPFFVWFNSTRMHIFTHLKKERHLEASGLLPRDHVGGHVDAPDVTGRTWMTLSSGNVIVPAPSRTARAIVMRQSSPIHDIQRQCRAQSIREIRAKLRTVAGA